MEAGYKVGRYTSPAVFDPLEVWRINQKNIEKERYAELFSKVKEACDRMVEKGMPHPTIFEVETAMAFCYFKEECCDYVLLELGMGGREDATNLISHPGLLGAYFDQHGPYAVLRGYDRTDRPGRRQGLSRKAVRQ